MESKSSSSDGDADGERRRRQLSGDAPPGSEVVRPSLSSSYSLTPALVCFLAVGAKPKRPAVRNAAVEAMKICGSADVEDACQQTSADRSSMSLQWVHVSKTLFVQLLTKPCAT